MNNVFVVSKDKKFYKEVAKHNPAIHIDHESLSEKALDEIIKKNKAEGFFVMQDKYDIPNLVNFPFDFNPLEKEQEYVHRWNDKIGAMWFQSSLVKEAPKDYTEEAMSKGSYAFKDVEFMEMTDDVWPAYILTNDFEAATQFIDLYPTAKHLEGDELTEKHLKKIIKQKEEFFYIIKGFHVFIQNFNFNLTPAEGSEEYVNVYDDDFTVLQFNKDAVKKDIKNFTDKALWEGRWEVKKNNTSVIKTSFDTTTYVLNKKVTEFPEHYVKLNTDTLTLHALNIIKRSCNTSYFYVINEYAETDIDLLAHVTYQHVALTFWNNDDSVRLFNAKKVFKDIKTYTDKNWHEGKITDVKQITNEDIHISVDLPPPESMYQDEKYDLVLLAHGWPDWCEQMAHDYGEITHIDSFTLGLREITEILEKCKKDYIYVATNYVDCKGEFKFNYKPPSFDSNYIHVWNDNDVIRAFNRQYMTEYTSYCTDQAMLNNIAEVKNIQDDTVSFAPLDIIFMSYGEPHADKNYKKLKERFPYAKRVDGVKGIFNAHKSASLVAGTHMFYVVDGDAVIDDNFDFSLYPNMFGQDCVYVWRSKNPCNGLEYGYGGIKLFPTHRVRTADAWRIDFTTSIARHFKVMPQISNITAYNTDAFSSWRSGFREGVKLSANVIANQNDLETKERIDVWTNEMLDAPFSKESRDGAKDGLEYGMEFINEPIMIKQINDYTWLKERYEKTRMD